MRGLKTRKPLVTSLEIESCIIICNRKGPTKWNVHHDRQKEGFSGVPTILNASKNTSPSIFLALGLETPPASGQQPAFALGHLAHQFMLCLASAMPNSARVIWPWHSMKSWVAKRDPYNDVYDVIIPFFPFIAGSHNPLYYIPTN